MRPPLSTSSCAQVLATVTDTMTTPTPKSSSSDMPFPTYPPIPLLGPYSHISQPPKQKALYRKKNYVSHCSLLKFGLASRRYVMRFARLHANVEYSVNLWIHTWGPKMQKGKINFCWMPTFISFHFLYFQHYLGNDPKHVSAWRLVYQCTAVAGF